MTAPLPHPLSAALSPTAYSVVTHGADEAPFAEMFDTLAEAADHFCECREWGIAATVMHGEQDMTAEATAIVRAWIEARGGDLPGWIEGEE